MLTLTSFRCASCSRAGSPASRHCRGRR